MGPLPHSGRPGLGPAARMPHSGLGSPRSRHPGRLPTHPAPTSAGPSGASGPGTEVAGTPERGPGAFTGHGGEEGRGLGTRPAGQARQSARCVSPIEHRCVESAKIRAKYPDRVPVSGLPALSPRCHPCCLGPVIGLQAIQQLTSLDSSPSYSSRWARLGKGPAGAGA